MLTGNHEQMPIALRAVDVAAIGKNDFTWSQGLPHVFVDELPTCNVQFPLEDPSQVAVLSWRWDTTPEVKVSRNVAFALQQAQRMGKRHLFMDRVSIDQTLPIDELLRAVMNLAALYETLPTIATYDEIGVDKWLYTMRRPWILREVRAFRTNPTKITYVGYLPKQGTDDTFGFTHMLEHIWTSTFTHSILMVLCGQVGMTTISDLRLIMGEHVDVLSAAYEQMPRNDYLLTAAILAQAGIADTRVNGDLDPIQLPYERYTFTPSEGGEYDSNMDVLLDGQKVAIWYDHYNLYHDDHRKKLDVEPDAERIIFVSLGLSESAYEGYVSREAERRAQAKVVQAEDVAKPEIEVVPAKFD